MIIDESANMSIQCFILFKCSSFAVSRCNVTKKFLKHKYLEFWFESVGYF